MPFTDVPTPPALDQERLLWLGASLLLYALGSVVAWTLSPSPRWPALRTFVGGPLRFLYFVGFPYAALLRGTVTLSALGLIGVAEAQHVRLGVAVTVAGVLAVGLWWAYLQRALHQVDGSYQAQELLVPTSSRWDWVFPLIEGGYREAHWAFYRALLVLLLRDPYAGAFLALALSLAETLADPATRYGLRTVAGAADFARTAGLAVLSTLLFVVTGTSWLGVAAHLITVGTMSGLSGWRVRAAADGIDPKGLENL